MAERAPIRSYEADRQPKLEISKNSSIGIPSERQGNVRSWSEMCGLLSDIGIEVDKQTREGRFTIKYFHAQKLLAEDHVKKATKIFDRLERRTGYIEFEEKNRTTLSIIDIAVKGKTRR